MNEATVWGEKGKEVGGGGAVCCVLHYFVISDRAKAIFFKNTEEYSTFLCAVYVEVMYRGTGKSS